jgi:glycosyltransferase involved in cell wall biosynthesis
MQRKKRILQICHDYKGPFRTIARQYAASFSDCEVKTVFLRGPHSASVAASINGEVEFLTLAPSSLRGLKLGALKQLRAVIGDAVPDLVIAHRYKPFYLATLLNRSLDIDLVLGVMHEYGFLGRTMRSLYSRFWPDNIELIGVSEPVCAAITQEHAHLHGRVHCVHHAIEAEPLLDSVSARHELGVPLGKYCYGVIGRLVAKKNHEQLITAFSQRQDDSVLALVGDGPLEHELKDRVEKLRLGDRVIFCGHHPDAKKLMKAFDCLVLSSTAEEAFGMVLLEAMAASTPVLSTDAPGPASVIGDTGLTFKSGDVDALAEGMERIRNLTREESEAMTRRALERLGQEYSIGTFVSRLRGLSSVAAVAPVTM